MHRIAIVSTLGLISVAAATAGSVQIQLGGSNGLTQSYITSGCSGTTCVAGSVAGTVLPTEGTFANVLFNSQNPSSSPTTPYQDTTNNITFSALNDSASSGSNTWKLPLSTPTATTTMTIPVGVFGVTDVWTMINDISSQAAATRDATITLNFGTTSNATTVDPVVIRLNNAIGTGTGQTRNSCEGSCNTSTGAVGGLLATTTMTPVSGATGNVTVDANSLYSGLVGNLCQNPQGIATSVVTSSSCSINPVYLDDQGLVLGTLALNSAGFSGLSNLSTYLVSINVKEINTSSANSSGMALTAVTIDASTTAPTPEPSTVLLLLAGFGVIGFVTLRRRVRA